HREPFFIDRFLEGFVFSPHNHFNDVVHRATGRLHYPAHVGEHQFALALDVRWRFPRSRFHAENSAAHHERTNEATHWNRVFVLESGDFETAASAHEAKYNPDQVRLRAEAFGW